MKNRISKILSGYPKAIRENLLENFISVIDESGFKTLENHLITDMGLSKENAKKIINQIKGKP